MLRARLYVAGDRLGFYREGTHTLCDGAATHQLTTEAYAAVAGVASALGKQLSVCSSLLVSENADASARVVCCATVPGASLDPFLGMALPPGVTGLVVQAKKGEFVPAGQDRLVDHSAALPGDAAAGRPAVTWTRRGAAFFQGNRFLVIIDLPYASWGGGHTLLNCKLKNSWKHIEYAFTYGLSSHTLKPEQFQIFY